MINNGAAQVPGIQGSQVAGEARLGDQSSLEDKERLIPTRSTRYGAMQHDRHESANKK